MAIDPHLRHERGRRSGLRGERDGQTFYFFSEHCRMQFLSQSPPTEKEGSA